MKYRVVSCVLAMTWRSALLLTCIAVPVHAQVTESGTTQADPSQEERSADEPRSFQGNVFIGSQAGIAIDAMGVLRRQVRRDNATLHEQRMAAALTSLDGGMLRPGRFRKVSLQQFDAYGRCAWAPGYLLPKPQWPVQVSQTPEDLATIAAAVPQRNRPLTPSGARIAIRPAPAVRTDRRLPDTDRVLEALRESARSRRMPADQWWWD